jgi:hypothetical protein
MAMGFIGPDGRLQECTVLETGRKRADREALDQASADPVAGDREPVDPEVVAPVVVLVDGLVAAADGPHDNAIRATHDIKRASGRASLATPECIRG